MQCTANVESVEMPFAVEGAYKPVDKKARPVDTTTPEAMKTIMTVPDDLMDDLPVVRTDLKSTAAIPEGKRLTRERLAPYLEGDF